ncbi:unnamed protein product [Lactuca saligna]|uniref:Uncharacterized protein n=1 Tax=Lactuca saligna TaxID=75948 RepID=A0AA35Z046_LACSI|nr:unnamed protein product [Lactuca saligna]
MAKKISKKQRKQRKLIIQDDSMNDEVVPESPLNNDQAGNSSHVRDSPVKSNIEETGNPDRIVKTSIVDITINQGEQPRFRLLNRQLSYHSKFQLSNHFMRRFELQASLQTYLIWMKISTRVMKFRQMKPKSDMNNELRVKAQSETFNGELKDLKEVSRKRHVLFVQDVKNVLEDVNRKIKELHSNVAKELQEVINNYSSVLEKVDIIAEAVTKIAQCYYSMLPKMDAQAEYELKQCGKIDLLLVELKAMVSKSSSPSLFTPEFLT